MASVILEWGCCTNEGIDENEQFINCIMCNKSYHFLCLTLPEIPSDSEIFSQWKCPDCMNKIKCRSAKKCDSTPIRNVTTARGNKRIALNSPPKSNPVTAEEVRSIVQEVIQVQYATMLQQMNTIIVNTINTELAPVRKDIQELQASLTFHTEEFDKLQSKYKEISNETKGLKNENEHLKNTVSDLNTRINYLEQNARSNNLELQCLPENRNENLITIIKQLGSVVGYEVKDCDVLHSTRIAKISTNNSRPRSIVVQLATPRKRDELLAAVITYNRKNAENKLNTADFGLACTKSPVYVVEHLSLANKALHAAARLRAKEKGYKYVWVRNGKIFIKKSDDSDHILIKSRETLNKII